MKFKVGEVVVPIQAEIDKGEINEVYEVIKVNKQYFTEFGSQPHYVVKPLFKPEWTKYRNSRVSPFPYLTYAMDKNFRALTKAEKVFFLKSDRSP